MAAPALIPIIKKVATYIATNPKALKKVVGIVIGVVVIIAMPIIALLGIFTGGVDLNIDRLQEMIVENQSSASGVMTEIEEKMLSAGYSHLNVKEAQAIYSLALFTRGSEEGFTDTLVGCFSKGQSDEDLIAKVNAAFGTNILASDFTSAVQKMRDEHIEPEPPPEETEPPDTSSETEVTPSG